MKIGIITHYYKSVNYGGNLQAYALCRVLNHHGYQAEQICYDKSGDSLFHDRRKSGPARAMRGLASRVKKTIGIWKLRKVQPKLRGRSRAVQQFNEDAIPHSTVCYNQDTIAQANREYDVFITGSDQVWHPKAVCGAYLLDFADDEKTMLSYAASVSTDQLPADILGRYRHSLARYSAVSVREEDAVSLIAPISPVEVQWVLDPTLLLDRQQWDELASERIEQQPYLMCYFLGDAEADRKLAEEYARSRGLQIVTLPHLNGKYNSCDASFGDRQLYDVSPNDLISLIKYAQCVFTDSFHATVFSIIYEKDFFVFQRSGNVSMSTRINSLVGLVSAESHFCAAPGQMTLEYIDSVPPVAYTQEKSRLAEMKKVSREFLFHQIQKAEKKMQSHES